MASLDEIKTALGGQEVQIAQFLGSFTAWANVASIAIGTLVVPRILMHLGVGFANMLYSVATVVGFGLLIGVPSLPAAATARFVEMQLKDALKTPLSALFYGAEPPEARSPARALTFGLVIPAATLLTSGALQLIDAAGGGAIAVAALGLAGAVAFSAASVVQNGRWRRRMFDLLAFKLARHGPTVDEHRLERARDLLNPFASRDPARLDQIARGLSSSHARLCAVAEEALAEIIPRKRAHDIARELRVTS
jgi:hypothetical protein